MCLAWFLMPPTPDRYDLLYQCPQVLHRIPHVTHNQTGQPNRDHPAADVNTYGVRHHSILGSQDDTYRHTITDMCIRHDSQVLHSKGKPSQIAELCPACLTQ
jgi:hypothetical protein